LPVDVPGYGGWQQKQDAYNKLLARLSFTTTANSLIKKANVGKGSFILGDDLQELLNDAAIRRENLAEQGLQFNRRRYAGGHYYFISNKSNKAFDGWVVLASQEKNIILFDPMLQRSGIAQTRKKPGGSTEIHLQLNQAESCILQASAHPINGNQYAYLAPGTPETVNGSWQIRFISGGPTLPATVSTANLGSWTDLGGDEVKTFSGTASYTTHFHRPKINAPVYLLDLGKAEETAEVFINGKRLATLLGPVYQISIPAAQLKEDNTLEIKVTNGMANRVADLDKRGIAWKKFYNTNFPARLQQNRGPDGLFTAAQWQPKASGLIGPVTLTPAIFVK
jgi:hypothetical protein